MLPRWGYIGAHQRFEDAWPAAVNMRRHFLDAAPRKPDFSTDFTEDDDDSTALGSTTASDTQDLSFDCVGPNVSRGLLLLDWDD